MAFDSPPLISVIMPVFNCEKYVSEAIESILHQTYSNLELLIGNDGSNDNSRWVIEEYLHRDPRIRYFENGENRGAAFTRNFLIEKSAGDFIALMDADDICDKDRLIHQLKFLIANNLDACGTNYCTIDTLGKIVEYHRNACSYEEILWSAFHNFSFCNASLLVKKQCLMEINGYQEGFRSEAEDIEMLFRFLLRKFRIETLNHFSYCYRLHNYSVSKRLIKEQKRNSLFATKALLGNLMGANYSEGFLHFMKYFHRRDFRLDGNCLLYFKALERLRKSVEQEILMRRFKHPAVRADIGRKMLFLSLNYRFENLIGSIWLLVKSLWYCPHVAQIVIQSKWNRLR